MELTEFTLTEEESAAMTPILEEYERINRIVVDAYSRRQFDEIAQVQTEYRDAALRAQGAFEMTVRLRGLEPDAFFLRSPVNTATEIRSTQISGTDTQLGRPWNLSG